MDIRDAAGLVAKSKLTREEVVKGDTSKLAYLYEAEDKAKKLKKKMEVKKFRLFGMGKEKSSTKSKVSSGKTNIAKPPVGQTGGLSIPAKNSLKATLVVVAAGMGVAGAKALARNIAGRNERKSINDAYVEKLRIKVRAKMQSGAVTVTNRELKDASEYIEDRGVYNNLIYDIENKGKVDEESDQFTEEELMDSRKAKRPRHRVRSASIRGKK